MEASRSKMAIMLCLFFALHLSLVASQEPVDGGFSDWTVDPTVDCCMFGGFEMETRQCNNPKPQNNGKDCFGALERWRRCSCGCEMTCDGVTAFCANETGNPAYCMCVYGQTYEQGTNKEYTFGNYTIKYNDNATSCLLTKAEMVTATNVTKPTNGTKTVRKFTSGDKTIANLLQFIFCGWVIGWCIGAIITCAVLGAAGGWHRIVHMMEEIMLIILYVFLGYIALNVASVQGLCKLTSAMTHYFIMAVFAFYTTEGLLAYSIVTGISPKDGIIKPAGMNILFGLGVPLIPFIASFAALYKKYGENGVHCWCDLDTAQAWAFFMPVVILFFCAGILGEACGLGDYLKLPDHDEEQMYWGKVVKNTLVMLLCVTMFAYFIGAVAMDQQSLWVFILFHVFNFVLGPMIFVCHTKCHSKVCARLHQAMPFLPFYKPENQIDENEDLPPALANELPPEDGVPPAVNQGPENTMSPVDDGGRDTDWKKFHQWVTNPDDTGNLAQQSENQLFSPEP